MSSNVLRNKNFSDVTKFLKSHGFVKLRVSGSHYHYFKSSKGRKYLVSVQFHGKRAIPIGTINSIIRQSGIDKEVWKKEL